MANIRSRPETGTLFFDFRYRGKRCREYTTLEDTPANRRKAQKVFDKIQAEITLGTFEYRRYFPNSPLTGYFEAMARGRDYDGQAPRFETFAEQWFSEKRVEWKRSYQRTVRFNLSRHLVPYFGDAPIDRISRADLLAFRSELAKKRGHGGGTLSADRINHVMTTLRMIMDEGADRHQFPNPFVRIKPLKVPKVDVDPFTLPEVCTFLENVRPDYRNYYVVRFFTGLRTGEIDGLKWQYVDFERRLIIVRETAVDGHVETPKARSSYREVQMGTLVYDALRDQYTKTGQTCEYVFCTHNGTPLSHHNVSKRVWYPTLRYLKIKPRRPYQTRHTAATLWLAAGENPEWIARQLGHANTRMLFERYSRYVPNLTRQDGRAIEALLQTHLGADI